DPDRGFVPGNVVGQAAVNTPSLRGVWSQAILGHHAAAHTVAEAILGPGHPALAAGENGWAVDSSGALAVHGATAALTPAQVAPLLRFGGRMEGPRSGARAHQGSASRVQSFRGCRLLARAARGSH